jgi:hypothetical protein
MAEPGVPRRYTFTGRGRQTYGTRPERGMSIAGLTDEFLHPFLALKAPGERRRRQVTAACQQRAWTNRALTNLFSYSL